METILFRAFGFILIIIVGYAFKKRGVITVPESKVISKIIMNITLPAALASGFQGVVINSTLISIIFLGLLTNMIMLFVGFIVSRRNGSMDKVFYMINSSGYNIGNFTIPFAQAFFPSATIASLCMFDMGNGIMCLGVSFAIVSSIVSKGNTMSVKGFFKILFSSPSFVTYIFMFIITSLKIYLPDGAYSIIKLFAKNSKKAFDNSLKEIVWIATYAYSTGLFLSKKGIFLLINRNNNSDEWNKYLDEIKEVPEYIKEELRFDGGTCRFIEKNMSTYSYKSNNTESEYIKLEAYARHHDDIEESTPVKVIETHTEENAESSNSSVEGDTDKKEEESLANNLFIITDNEDIHIPLKNTECGYYKDHNFYTNDSYIAEIPKKVGNFYIDILKSIVYQFDGDQYVYIDTISVKLNNNKEDIKAENKKLDDQYREAVYHDKDPVGDILLLPAISSFQQTSEEKDEQKTSTDSVQPIKEDPNSTTSESAQSNTQTPIQSKEYTIGLNRITKRKNQEKVYSFGDILKLWREGDNS